MKKGLLLGCVCLLLVGCSSSPKEVKLYNDGDYIGVGAGMCGSIQVQVHIEESKIQSIQLIKSSETHAYQQEVEEKLIPKIIEKNSLEGIDEVTGATETSKGVLTGVNVALGQAKINQGVENE